MKTACAILAGLSTAAVAFDVCAQSWDEAIAPDWTVDDRMRSGARGTSVTWIDTRHDALGSDTLRLTREGVIRRADGSPLPPDRLDDAGFEASGYDLDYRRDWVVAAGRTASGFDVSLSPHAGVGLGSRGGSARAGATLKVGRDLGGLIPNGASFGDRTRWYVFAAGSGTAVGYNFARTRDGDYVRSGVSRDHGAFLGDATIGVALRRGSMQGSFGVVYREIEAEGLYGGDDLDTEVKEGLIAFQLSIKPR